MSEKLKNKLFYLIILIFFLLFVYKFYKDDRESKLLKSSKETLGFLVDISEGGAHDQNHAEIKFTVNKRKYSFRHNSNFSFMKLGDTVLIKYAVKDHNVATVIDKYYMKKYKYLK